MPKSLTQQSLKMSGDFDLADAVMCGSFEAVQRFDGLKNTQELISTVEEMFDGANISVTSVQCDNDKFNKVFGQTQKQTKN